MYNINWNCREYFRNFLGKGECRLKMNKKFVMASSFCIGALMLVTTAFADMASKSGYDQLKDAVKQTAKKASTELPNYTVEFVSSVKYDGKVVYTESEKKKFDRVNGMEENDMSREHSNGKVYKSYNYNDKKQFIYYAPDSDTYHITEYSEDRKTGAMTDPFEDDMTKDVEMIFDAVVGNLKDYVAVEEKPDGTRVLSGNISEVQIPAVVNAAASFLFKREFAGGSWYNTESGVQYPALASDIVLKSVSGKAVVDKDGIIESLSGNISLAGKDKDGTFHKIELELAGGVSDIGKTAVKTPELAGKKVERSVQRDYDTKTVSKKYIGKYGNDIVVDKDSAWTKAGERIVEIENIDGKSISGKYYEIWKPEYEEYAAKDQEFTFKAEIRGYNYADFTIKSSSGEELRGTLNFSDNARLHFSRTGQVKDYNRDFSRIFED